MSSSAAAAAPAPGESINGYDANLSVQATKEQQQCSTSAPVQPVAVAAHEQCIDTAVNVSTHTCNSTTEGAQHQAGSTAAAQTAQQESCSLPADGSRKRRLLSGLKQALVRLAALSIQAIVVIEIAKFGIGRLRLARYMGRRERWCADTSDELAYTSSDGDGEGDDVGTSTDLADAVLDYLAEDQDPKELNGLTQQQVARGMRKIQALDLQDIGIEGEAATAMLQQLHASADRLDPSTAGRRHAQSADNSRHAHGSQAVSGSAPIRLQPADSLQPPAS